MSTTNGDTPDLRERPIGEIAGELTRDLSLLVRQELELAKAEMAEKAKVAAPGLGMLGGASVVGLMAAGALTACLVLVLVDLPAVTGCRPSLSPSRWPAARLPARRSVARQQVAKAGAPDP